MSDTTTEEISLNDLFDAPQEQPQEQADITGTVESLLTETPDIVIPTAEITPPEEEQEAPTSTNSTYTDLIKDYLEEGDWEDVELEFKEGEPKVLLSELKDVDRKTFRLIEKSIKAHKDEQNKDKFVSVEGLDETTLQMIKLKKAGGDLSPLIKHEAEFLHPLKDMDVENDPRAQEWLVRQKLVNQGLEPEIIESTIAHYKANFKLDSVALEVKNQIDANYKVLVENKLKEKEAENLAYQEQQKNYKQGLTEQYKSLNLKETVYKNLVESAVKTDEHGLTKTDRLYFEAKENPEFYTKLNYFINNPKEFEEFMGVKVKNAEATKNFIKIATAEKKATSATIEKPGANDAWSDFAAQPQT